MGETASGARATHSAQGTAHAGKVAIVTGAGSGIGRATAQLLVAGGASVVAVDLDEPDLGWADGDASVASLAGDVSTESANIESVALAVERFGGLDISVLNAGVSSSGDLVSAPIDGFDRTMEVNVRGVVLGIRAAVPAMRNRNGGAIAVTASTSGLRGDPGMWAYNASKAAVINLVRAAALDLGPVGIRVNAVAPGPTETAMTERIGQEREVYEGLRRRMALQRWAQPEEVAAVFDFLVSDAASIVTGAVVPADGGMSASTGQFLPAEKVSP